MAILIECPNCKKRQSVKTLKCSCGVGLQKQAHKNYWIEYYILGRRKRERIGPSKAAAEQRLREVLKARTEERYIDKNKNIKVTFDELKKWYLELPQIKAKKSYIRDCLSLRTLSNFFSGKVVSEITVNKVEAYRQLRLNEASYRKQKTCPATINREIACLRHMLNLAEQETKIDSVPFKGKVRMLKENNVRNRILSHDEYVRLLQYCPQHTAQIVRMAYFTAMRIGEIINLTWGKVDLANGFIHLRPEDTKGNEGRTIPLNQELTEMLSSIPRTIHGKVFTHHGKPLRDIKTSFWTFFFAFIFRNF